MTAQPQTMMLLEEAIQRLGSLMVGERVFPEDEQAANVVLHHLEAQRKECECDGRTFESTLDAALHLLWLLQRLSFFEPEREGQPCDGFRFRQGIIEARKLLNSLDYENTIQKKEAPTKP